MSFLSRAKERLVFSFRTPVYQGDLHFVSAQALEPLSWCSSPLHGRRAVVSSGERRAEGFSLGELLEEEKDL